MYSDSLFVCFPQEHASYFENIQKFFMLQVLIFLIGRKRNTSVCQFEIRVNISKDLDKKRHQLSENLLETVSEISIAKEQMADGAFLFVCFSRRTCCIYREKRWTVVKKKFCFFFRGAVSENTFSAKKLLSFNEKDKHFRDSSGAFVNFSVLIFGSDWTVHINGRIFRQKATYLSVRVGVVYIYILWGQTCENFGEKKLEETEIKMILIISERKSNI